jgi:hypothetical protein
MSAPADTTLVKPSQKAEKNCFIAFHALSIHSTTLSANTARKSRMRRL